MAKFKYDSYRRRRYGYRRILQEGLGPEWTEEEVIRFLTKALRALSAKRARKRPKTTPKRQAESDDILKRALEYKADHSTDETLKWAKKEFKGKGRLLPKSVEAALKN